MCPSVLWVPVGMANSPSFYPNTLWEVFTQTVSQSSPKGWSYAVDGTSLQVRMAMCIWHMEWSPWWLLHHCGPESQQQHPAPREQYLGLALKLGLPRKKNPRGTSSWFQALPEVSWAKKLQLECSYANPHLFVFITMRTATFNSISSMVPLGKWHWLSHTK